MKKLLSIIALLGATATAPLCAERITLTNSAPGDVYLYLGAWTAMPTEVELTGIPQRSRAFLPGGAIAIMGAALQGLPDTPSQCVFAGALYTGLVIKHVRNQALDLGKDFRAFIPIPADISEIHIIGNADGTAQIHSELGPIEGVVIVFATEQPVSTPTRQSLLREMGVPRIE